MKKEIILVLSLFLVILILLGVLAFIPSKQVIAPAKTGIVVASIDRIDGNFADITVKGYINGDGWVPFEGQAGVANFYDKSNKFLGYAILATIGDWMSNPPINFEGKIRMTPWEADSVAKIVFKNENPSGDPKTEKQYDYPVKIVKSNNETMKVKVFFGKNGITGSTCDEVFSVERIVPKTTAVARAALEELLKGPTQEEKSIGYFSGINAGVKINRLVILDGTGIVDFSEEMNGGGGSCRVTEIRAEINSTLKQFPTINGVIISVNGDTETALQP